MYTDFLIKIKNAQMTGKKMMKTRSTRMDKVIAEILQRNGFIESVEVKGRPSKRFMFLDVRAKRKIEGVRFYSKPSVHQYIGYKEIKVAKGGHGLTVLSTPKGVMTGKQAKQEKVGGELLFQVW